MKTRLRGSLFIPIGGFVALVWVVERGNIQKFYRGRGGRGMC